MEKIPNRDQMLLKLKVKLIDWSSSSTSHGFPNIFKAKNMTARILWAICFLASVGMCAFLTFQAIGDFLNNEVLTSVRIIYETPMVLPAITICNSNPFTTDFSYDFMARYFNKSAFEYFDFARMSNLAKSSLIDDETRTKFGLNASRSILGLYLGDYPIEQDQLLNYYDVFFGNCFKFNSGFGSSGKPIPLMSTSIDGIDSALAFRYFSGITDESKLLLFGNYGLHIYIHNSSSDPLPSEGIDLQPGTSNIIILNKVVSRRQPYPYSECRDLKDFSSEFVDYFKKTNKIYRRRECFNLCIQKYINSECRCNHLVYPVLRNLSACITESQDACRGVVGKNISQRVNELCTADCPLECESITYGLTLSSSKYPTKQLVEALDLDKHIPGRNLTYDQVKDSFLMVNVFFDQLRYTLIEESPSISMIQLVSNIGGTLGLFIGISILSFVEVLELFVDLVYLIFC